jgi:hypothetical protein
MLICGIMRGRQEIRRRNLLTCDPLETPGVAN